MIKLIKFCWAIIVLPAALVFVILSIISFYVVKAFSRRKIFQQFTDRGLLIARWFDQQIFFGTTNSTMNMNYPPDFGKYLEYKIHIAADYAGSPIPLLPPSPNTVLPRGINITFGEEEIENNSFQSYYDFVEYYTARTFLFDEIQIATSPPFEIVQQSRNIFGKKDSRRSESIAMERNEAGYFVFTDFFYSASPHRISYIHKLIPVSIAYVRLKFRDMTDPLAP